MRPALRKHIDRCSSPGAMASRARADAPHTSARGPAAPRLIVGAVEQLDLGLHVGDREVPGLGHQPGVGQGAAQPAPVAGAERLQQSRVQDLGRQPLPLQGLALASDDHGHAAGGPVASPARCSAAGERSARCGCRGGRASTATSAVPPAVSRTSGPAMPPARITRARAAQRRGHRQRVGCAGRDADQDAIRHAELHQGLGDVGTPGAQRRQPLQIGSAVARPVERDDVGGARSRPHRARGGCR